MSYLLDTNVFLWSVGRRDSLNKNALELLRSKSSNIYLSAASAWEISIKYALGKIVLPAPPVRFISQVMNEFGYEGLEIRHSHVAAVSELPLHHKDPFDRLLVAQAREESLTMMTADRNLARYDVQLVVCGV